MILFFSAFELYAFQALKTITTNRALIFIYTLITLLILGNFAYNSIIFNRVDGFSHSIGYAIGLFLALFIAQLCIILILFFEDFIRISHGIYNYFTNRVSEKFLPNRRKFISQIALVLSAVPFTSLLYGMIYGRYNYKVLKYSLTFDDLPKEFDGFIITQISDIHCGSFDNEEKVKYGIELINQQKSDLILFTGDMVNNKTEELYPWIEIFGSLEAPFGKYSVLGNHDYGDYTQWENDQDKIDNLVSLKNAQKKMGFNLLLNESKYIEKGSERISIVGVENWGKGGFKKAGDLNKSVNKVKKSDFKILMTHDPSHWEEEVLTHPFPFHLTLSGHTHGMQFGIEIPGWIKWSPIKWRYKQWAGIYQKDNQYLNVNRGFGYLAYPGRVGIWPEISVITLKSSNSTI